MASIVASPLQASAADRHLDIILFRMQVVQNSSLVSVLFREVFSHPYISFFHLLVNGLDIKENVGRGGIEGKGDINTSSLSHRNKTRRSVEHRTRALTALG